MKFKTFCFSLRSFEEQLAGCGRWGRCGQAGVTSASRQQTLLAPGQAAMQMIITVGREGGGGPLYSGRSAES